MKRNMMRIVLAVLFALAMVCTAVACKGEEPKKPDAVVTLAVHEITLDVGGEQTLVATVSDETVPTWASADNTIATVDASGKVTAVAKGETVVTVTTADGKSSDSCVITVRKPVASVEISETSKTLNVGENFTLSATVLPADANDKAVAWSSSDSSIATVNANGKVVAVAKGTATITVTTTDGNKTATCTVTVIRSVIGVSLNETSAELKVEDTLQLVATITPIGASDSSVTWDSDDADVATVDENGLVTAVGKGTATITVTTVDGGFTATCEISVITTVTGVAIDEEASEGEFAMGETKVLTAVVSPADADNKAVTWTSSDETVATVSNGTVSMLAEGDAVITVTTVDGNFTATYTVHVVNVSLPTELPKYMAKGQSIEIDKGLDFTTISGDAISFDEENGKLSAEKAGVYTFKLGKLTFEQEYTIKVIDFGNTTGETFDLATDLSLWQYRNYSGDDDVTITYEEHVADTRAVPYTFNALKYNRPQNNGQYRALTGNLIYLKPEVIALAKEVGYVGITFTVLTVDDPAGESSYTLSVYNVNDDGSLMWVKSNSDPIVSKELDGKWARYSFDLSNEKLFEGAGIGFGTYGRTLYLAKVEFFGADISEYASAFITDSGAGNATVGKKSNDMISEELIGKMFTSVSNTATLTYGEGGGKEAAIGGNDYIKLTKDGYKSTEYFTYNQIRISSEWIQAAKSLGYNVIAIFILDLANFEKASYCKVAVDGKCYAANSADSGRWYGTSAGFVSLDISNFEAGESIVLCCKGSEVAIGGVTFRESDPRLTCYNYDANVA